MMMFFELSEIKEACANVKEKGWDVVPHNTLRENDKSDIVKGYCCPMGALVVSDSKKYEDWKLNDNTNYFISKRIGDMFAVDVELVQQFIWAFDQYKPMGVSKAT